MSSRFVVASVPHTGTGTLEALLDRLGVDFERVHMGQGIPGPGQQADEFKFLIPLRDPRKVWVSYWNQDLPTDSLSYRWGLLAALTHERTTHVVPIDRPLHAHAWGDLAHYLELSPHIYSLPQLRAFFDSTWVNAHPHIRLEKPPIPDWVEGERRRWGYT